MVAWSLGREVREFRGGWQRNGERSRIATKSILAIKGTAPARTSTHPASPIPCFSPATASCAPMRQAVPDGDLSRDTCASLARRGDTWTNTVAACRHCNIRKGGQTPEQAHMPLLYVPYVPNRHEHFILRNRRILADQMEYLLAGVPRTSRLHTAPVLTR